MDGRHLELGVRFTAFALLITVVAAEETPAGSRAYAVSLLAMAFPNGHIVNHVGNEWLRIHLMIALVAYGLSTVAALHAVLMTALDRQLHRPILHQEQRGLFSRVLDTMPPLLVQEELLFRLMMLPAAAWRGTRGLSILRSTRPFRLTVTATRW